MDTLRSKLESLGHSELYIKQVEATIEDCFMNLQKS